jgi:serine/threonine-protein kinase
MQALEYARRHVQSFVPFRGADFRGKVVLGQGAFGQVYLTSDARTGEQYVVKRIWKRKTKFDALWAELVALQRVEPVCHEASVCYDRLLEDGKAYYLTTRFLGAHMVDLGKAILNPERPLPDELKARIANNLVRALGAVHSRGVAHRDLKPANVLVDPATGAVRIIDFGASCWAGQCERDFTHGTEYYAAPELLARQDQEGAPVRDWTLVRYQRADVFALGATILEMMMGRHVPIWRIPQTIKDILPHRDTLLRHGGPDLFLLMNSDPERRPNLAT